MEFDLRKTAKEKIILVAHRGVSGGNIPCNTLPAYEGALAQGADMIEIDVTMSKDGQLFIFHPGMESAHLNQQCRIQDMTAEEVRGLRFVNQDNAITQFGLNTLDEILEAFKGRCYINCDKFWDYPRQISDRIRAHGMMEQMLVKTAPSKEMFDIIETYAPDVQYMVIVKKDAEAVHRELMQRGINYMGQELLFETEESPLCSPQYLEQLRKDNILSWANAIVYNHKAVLAAGHSDDTALSEDMEKGWGWLARRGFDFIQTDWPIMVKMYLEQQGLLYR
jgi:glycerophosphoryl diester phosphodiesterase